MSYYENLQDNVVKIFLNIQLLLIMQALYFHIYYYNLP